MDAFNKIDEYRKIEQAAEMLAYLNIARVRCTYKAFGEVLGVHPIGVSYFLGERRWEGSWVVSSACPYEPSRYQSKDIHPKLKQRHERILEGNVLAQHMNDGWGVADEGIEEWRGILSEALLNYLTVMRRFCTRGAFGEVLGVSASSIGRYLRKWQGDVSWVVNRNTEQPLDFRHANNRSRPAKWQDAIESGIELEALMRLHWQYSGSKVWSIRDMPISPKRNWWITEEI